jgi:hypothetical protein
VNLRAPRIPPRRCPRNRSSIQSVARPRLTIWAFLSLHSATSGSRQHLIHRSSSPLLHQRADMTVGSLLSVPSRPDLTVGLQALYHHLPLGPAIPEIREECSSRSAPTLHSQNPLDQLIRALVFLRCLLDSLTGCIPYAEPGDLGSIFPTQQCRTRHAHQVQAVAVTEQRSPLGVVHARRLVS